MRLFRFLLLTWLAFGLAALGPATAHAEQRSFALVLGTNLSNDPGVKPLRYADDDAVNNARLLGELGAEVVLLVHMDADTRRLAPDLPETAPTEQAVEEAMTRLNARMDEVRAKGDRPVLYLFYSGHGDVENNRGYVNLTDGRLWREDLLRLITRSRASENHVIVDACKSYFLVFDRGSNGTRAKLAGSLLGRKASLPENTGLLLSTSSASDSHEWEAFQGGVFSHEIRSALRGAADQDLDGRVTYEEAAAFVWTANASVPNPRYRPDVFVRAPGQRNAGEAVLAETRAAGGSTLVLGPGVREHLYVEDGLGRRLLDVRPSPEHQVALRLPAERPLFVHHVDSDQDVELPRGARLALSTLPKRAATSSTRGAEHVAFRSLFTRSFGPGALTAYRDAPPEMTQASEPRRDLTWLRRSVGLLGAATASLGGVMTFSALRARDDAQGRSGVARERANQRIERRNDVAVTSYVVAGASLAAFLGWTFWPSEALDIRVLPGRSASATLSGRF